MLSIIIADGQQLVRKGLILLLEQESWVKVVGNTGDGFEAITLVKKLKPDILLLEVSVGGIHGLEVLDHLFSEGATKIVVLTMRGETTYVREAMRRGARGYVLKDSQESELFTALREVAAGEMFLCALLREQSMKAVLRQVGGNGGADLTVREQMVLELAAQGFSATEIGKRLHVSRRTVESHRSNLMHKIGVTCQTALVRYAIRQGIMQA